MTPTAEQPSSLPGLSDTRLEEIETLGITAGAYGNPIDHDNSNVAECTRCKLGVAFSDLLAEVRRLQGAIRQHEEDEASVCPEDVGFVEYIRALESQIASAREETAQAVRAQIEACARTAEETGEDAARLECSPAGTTRLIANAIRFRASLPGETA